MFLIFGLISNVCQRPPRCPLQCAQQNVKYGDCMHGQHDHTAHAYPIQCVSACCLRMQHTATRERRNSRNTPFIIVGEVVHISFRICHILMLGGFGGILNFSVFFRSKILKTSDISMDFRWMAKWLHYFLKSFSVTAAAAPPPRLRERW
jgi:hypothetical protein